MNAYEQVALARAKGRPTATAFISGIFEDFFELHGDRLFGDDPAIVGGVARLCGDAVTVIGIEKGVDTADKIARNFGSPNPEGYRKALRLMQQAEKFARPVVCIVDTSGAYCGVGAEMRGQGSAIAQNLMAMMALKTPVVTILIGEGGSGGALALGVADQVWMLENAVYSVISPEGAASIIWKDAKRVREAAQALRLTAQDLLALGVADRIFQEPAQGKPFDALYQTLRQALKAQFAADRQLPLDALLQARYEKFRRIGRIDL